MHSPSLMNNMKKSHEMHVPIELRCYCLPLWMAKAKAPRKKCSEKVKCLPRPVKATSHAQDGTVVARQLITMHQPKSEQIFFETFIPRLFPLWLLWYFLWTRHEFLHFCNDTFIAYINNLQMENTQDSSSTSKYKHLTIVYTPRICHASF